jgi:large subunit ribosomal protein LP0
MSAVSVTNPRKIQMFEKTQKLFSQYNNFMILNLHRVQSTQFKNIIAELNPSVKILFAKKKIMKKALRELDETKYADLISQIKGNVLIAFFDGTDPKAFYELSMSNRRDSLAVAGDLATKDIVIPTGPTGLSPENINHFQAAKMNIKIVKGKIEVASDHVLVRAGKNVTTSQANLLKMLNIYPFQFGLEILKVFENGEVYDKDVLLIDSSDAESCVSSAIASVAALSLGTGMLTEASLPFEIRNAADILTMVSLAVDFPIVE